MKYFEVEAKCGHVRRNNYILKKFYVCAESASEAASITRHLPRVKHHQKDAIKNVIEIDYDNYILGLDSKRNDPYFLVDNSSDQRMACLFADDEIIREDEETFYRKPTHAKRRIVSEMINKDWKSGRSYLYE